MTTVTLELPDQIVRIVEQRALTRGTTLSQQVSELLEQATHVTLDDSRVEAIRRMDDLLAQVSGFQAEPRLLREELYERGSLR